jgi:hypothetical protein
MKITGLPGRKNMVFLFDADEIEKVSVHGEHTDNVYIA